MGRPPVLLCVLTGSLVFVVDLAVGASGQHVFFILDDDATAF